MMWNRVQIARLRSGREEAIDDQIAFSDDRLHMLGHTDESSTFVLPILHQSVGAQLMITSPVVDEDIRGVELPNRLGHFVPIGFAPYVRVHSPYQSLVTFETSTLTRESNYKA